MIFLYILLGIAVIAIFLLIPFVFKSRKERYFEGPDLKEFKYKEVDFFNHQANIKLSGMLFVPQAKGPFQVAVMIHGSGQGYRNNWWYLATVKKLIDSNIAVLLPDKRGCEKSEGSWKDSTLEELATDTVSAVEYIKEQTIFSYSDIGIIGLSQGGWIAPIAGSLSKDISFIVSMVGPTVTTDEQLKHEVLCDIEPYTYKFIAKMVQKRVFPKVASKPHVKIHLGFDPIPYWKKITVPSFLAFGENDKNVPVQDSLKRLKENKLNQFDVKVYPKGGHVVFDAERNTVSRDYLADLVQFIEATKKQ